MLKKYWAVADCVADDPDRMYLDASIKAVNSLDLIP
jgi:hypothetical protein